MRWGWLLPDASYEVLYDGWERQSYGPRHGRPPFVIRSAYSAAMALVRARARYLGVVDDEAVAGAGAQVTVGGGRVGATARAGAGSGAGLRAAAGLGAARVGSAARVSAASVSSAASGGATPRRQRTAD
jgi:hypothetical protein